MSEPWSDRAARDSGARGAEPTRTHRAFELARKVADVVLYEGYVLYPYRASAIKNRFRWQFGIVAPRGYAERGGADPCFLQTECLIESDGDPQVDLEVRYLQVEERRVEEALEDGGLQPVESLSSGGEIFTTWEEGVPRTIAVETLSLGELAQAPRRIVSNAPATESLQELHDDGRHRGRVTRRRQAIEVVVEVSAHRVGPLWRLRLRVENDTPWKRADTDRTAALRQSCAGTHALLAIAEGRFLSLADPPAGAVEAAGSCRNEHCWPVLLGERGSGEAVLASPIILDDYPQVAPESPGDLYDATEIDEILTLRIMTLTDDEKAEARSTDERARRVIERSDTIPEEVFARLHGAIRSLRPMAVADPLAGAPDPWRELLGEPAPAEEATLLVGTTLVGKGSRVELHPKRRADAMDMFLANRPATVAAVHRDVDDVAYVAVTLDDDPGRDLHDSYGRFYYFYPEEIEPIAADAGGTSAHETKE